MTDEDKFDAANAVIAVACQRVHEAAEKIGKWAAGGSLLGYNKAEHGVFAAELRALSKMVDEVERQAARASKVTDTLAIKNPQWFGFEATKEVSHD